MKDQRLADRPLPSLAEFLGDGNRAEGFEEWQRFMAGMEQKAQSSVDAQTARIFRTLSVAFTEAMRIESDLGGDLTQAVLLFPRLAGVALMGATICTLDADKHPPFLKIARVITDEFRAGAKQCALAHQPPTPRCERDLLAELREVAAAHARHPADIPEDLRIYFFALEMCGEAGETANQLKKMWRGDGGIEGLDHLAGARKELTDTVTIALLLADLLDLDVLSEALANMREFEKTAKWQKMVARG